ncbi:MAG TPA: PsiF family protein [Steroidobacteraceae bacterium]
MHYYACVAAILASAVIGSGAFAANTQQERMKQCNASAKSSNLSGDARKDYMSKCLSGDAPSTSANSQQQKMKTCNADATKQQLKGDDRKKFMSGCLKTT